MAEKDSANFCEYFDFQVRTWRGEVAGDPREEQARNELRRLLGGD